MYRRVLFALCLAAPFVGCAPSLSPLYRDYDVETAPTSASVEDTEPSTEETNRGIYDRIRAALTDAGWTEAPSAAENVVSTEPRQLSNWGLYRVVVSLDVVPVGEQHIRVLFHPARIYFTGGRSKIPYLGGGMRSALLPELNEAFEAQGLYPIGTPRERDEEQVAGT